MWLTCIIYFSFKKPSTKTNQYRVTIFVKDEVALLNLSNATLTVLKLMKFKKVKS